MPGAAPALHRVVDGNFGEDVLVVGQLGLRGLLAGLSLRLFTKIPFSRSAGLQHHQVSHHLFVVAKLEMHRKLVSRSGELTWVERGPLSLAVEGVDQLAQAFRHPRLSKHHSQRLTAKAVAGELLVEGAFKPVLGLAKCHGVKGVGGGRHCGCEESETEIHTAGGAKKISASATCSQAAVSADRTRLKRMRPLERWWWDEFREFLSDGSERQEARAAAAQGRGVVRRLTPLLSTT